MRVTKRSAWSDELHTQEIPITEAELEEWEVNKAAGTSGLIQDVFPHLSADDREFLLTGITPEEWEVMWGESDE